MNGQPVRDQSKRAAGMILFQSNRCGHMSVKGICMEGGRGVTGVSEYWLLAIRIIKEAKGRGVMVSRFGIGNFSRSLTDVKFVRFERNWVLSKLSISIFMTFLSTYSLYTRPGKIKDCKHLTIVAHVMRTVRCHIIDLAWSILQIKIWLWMIFCLAILAWKIHFLWLKFLCATPMMPVKHRCLCNQMIVLWKNRIYNEFR